MIDLTAAGLPTRVDQLAPAIPPVDARRSDRATLAALVRVHVAYLWRHGRLLSLRNPGRFTQLVQRRKLTDRDPRRPLLIDKLTAKQFVARTLGLDRVQRFVRGAAEDWHGI